MHTFSEYPILDLVLSGPQVATGRGRVPGWVTGFDISPISGISFPISAFWKRYPSKLGSGIFLLLFSQFYLQVHSGKMLFHPCPQVFCSSEHC